MIFDHSYDTHVFDGLIHYVLLFGIALNGAGHTMACDIVWYAVDW